MTKTRTLRFNNNKLANFSNMKLIKLAQTTLMKDQNYESVLRPLGKYDCCINGEIRKRVGFDDKDAN